MALSCGTKQQQTNSNQNVFVLWLKLRDGEKMFKEINPPFFKVLQSYRQTSFVYVGSTKSWFVSQTITFLDHFNVAPQLSIDVCSALYGWLNLYYPVQVKWHFCPRNWQRLELSHECLDTVRSNQASFICWNKMDMILCPSDRSDGPCDCKSYIVENADGCCVHPQGSL